MALPALHWEALRDLHPTCEVELRGEPGTQAFVALTQSGPAIVDWSSFDAVTAQSYLHRRVRRTATLRATR